MLDPLAKAQNAIVDILSRKSNPVIFITGPSGSGKTTLANRLAEMNMTYMISFDWWIKEASNVRRQKIMSDFNETHSIPDPLGWYDWDAFKTFLRNIKQQRQLNFTEAWNQQTGEKDLDIKITFTPDQPIIIEGVYLYEVAELADYIIALDIDIETSTHRALTRQSERNPEDYLEVKRKWYLEYDKPYFEQNSKKADLVIDSMSHQGSA